MLNAFSEPKAKNQKLKANLGRPWVVVLTTLMIFLLSQFIAALLVGLGTDLVSPNSSLIDLLNQSAPAQFFYVLLAEGLAFGLTVLVVKKVRGLKLAAIGLGRRPQAKDIWRAIVGAGAFYGLLIAASIIISILAPGINTNETQEVGFNSLNSSLDQILAFAALVFLPPIGEETLVRGYLYSGLRARWNFRPALLVTSVLFGFAHLGSGANGGVLWAAGIDTFILSVVLVYLRERTGALYAGMLVHALNNVIAFGVHFHT